MARISNLYARKYGYKWAFINRDVCYLTNSFSNVVKFYFEHFRH